LYRKENPAAATFAKMAEVTTSAVELGARRMQLDFHVRRRATSSAGKIYAFLRMTTSTKSTFASAGRDVYGQLAEASYLTVSKL
jgi:hypothetical protein